MSYSHIYSYLFLICHVQSTAADLDPDRTLWGAGLSAGSRSTSQADMQVTLAHLQPHSRRLPCACGPVPASKALWLLLLLLLWTSCPCEARPEHYKSTFNKSCKYSARNVSRALFKEGIDDGFLFLMPLESNYVVVNYLKPWEACFGPAEPLDLAQLQAGKKLPCFYRINQWGNYDYWEENACDILVRSNCYCYALSRYVGSYCEPGLGSTGTPLPLPVQSCAASAAGVLADGARQVDRKTVYTVPTTGHYIALAVKPPSDERDTGDYHFWRLDADGTWSYKAGDTLSRNTYRNGTALRDIEMADARGAYKEFCGYYEVQPHTHKLKGNNYYFSSLPGRFKLWQDLRVKGTVTPLPTISPAWLAAYRGYYADAGWEDGLPSWALARERAAEEAGVRDAVSKFRTPPHTYSVRPYQHAAGQQTTGMQPGS